MNDQSKINQGHPEPSDFYSSLEEGNVVHFHHSFGRFVRCKVVIVKGERRLRMIALVGDWFDGPERRLYVKRLGDVFLPDPLTIYENPAASVHDEGRADPRGAEPTDTV